MGLSPATGVDDKAIVDSETAPDVISLSGGMPVPARPVDVAFAVVVVAPEEAPDEVEDEPDSVPLEVDDAELDPEVEEEDDEGAWRLTIRACLALTSAAEAIVRRVARAIKAFMMLSGKELLGQTLG